MAATSGLKETSDNEAPLAKRAKLSSSKDSALVLTSAESKPSTQSTDLSSPDDENDDDNESDDEGKDSDEFSDESDYEDEEDALSEPEIVTGSRRRAPVDYKAMLAKIEAEEAAAKGSKSVEEKSKDSLE